MRSAGHESLTLSSAAHQIADTLAGPPLPSAVLRMLIGDCNRYQRAVLELQRHLMITTAGVQENRSGWPSAPLDLTCRRFQVGAGIDHQLAATRFLNTMLQATPADLARTFRWPPAQARATSTNWSPPARQPQTPRTTAPTPTRVDDPPTARLNSYPQPRSRTRLHRPEPQHRPRSRRQEDVRTGCSRCPAMDFVEVAVGRSPVAYRSPVLTPSPVLTALVGLAGAVVAALIGAGATIRTRPPRKSRVELVDVSLSKPDPTRHVKDDPPVLDIMIRNIGGQTAVLKRMVVHIHQAVRFDDTSMPTPYDAGPGFVGAGLDVSATYDVELPEPGDATDEPISTGLAQVVSPGEADRFRVRLAQHFVCGSVAYLLHLEVLHDADDRKVTSRRLALVFPQRVVIASADEIRHEIRRFQETVNEIRRAIDEEMSIRGRPVPDWFVAPPRHRGELPDDLLSVDGNGNIFDSGQDGVYIVNENFWDPEHAIHRFLDGLEQRYRKVLEICTAARVVHEPLRDKLPSVQATLAQLPALRADLRTPNRAATVQTPAPTGDPDTDGELVRLLGGQDVLNKLRTLANAGDERVARQLSTAFRLAEKVRRLGPSNSEALNDRDKLIQWWMTTAGDMARAAAAWAELIRDQLPVYGPDHQNTLQARHFLAKCRGESGDATGAAAAFAELVSDRVRVLGADHSATLDSRHELARWRAMAGDAAGAAEAFAELVADRVRVQGPEHRRTFSARYNLAYCRGKAGDAAGAAEAFAELVSDQIRALGPDDPDTVASQRALAHWQDQIDPEREA